MQEESIWHSAGVHLKECNHIEDLRVDGKMVSRAGVRERRFGGFAWIHADLDVDQLRGSVNTIMKFRVA